MKILIAILLCGPAAMPAHATPVLGIWQYDGFFFQGQRYPNPNPALFLTFTFTDNSSRLYWQRKGEPGFCERIAEYKVDQNVLHQKVTWVNPRNNPDCAKDPDMQLGAETQVRYGTTGDYLQLYFAINGQEFMYLLKRIGCIFD